MSSADVGTAALVVGFGTALYAVGAGAYSGLTGRREWAVSARRAIYALLGLLVLAMVLLEAAYIRSDFSFELVAQNSSTDTPTFYKLTAMWSSQAGSLLLWVFLLALFSSAVLFLTRRRLRDITPYATAVLGGVAAFFLFLMLFYASPFATLANAPAEGNGLNPLLRHPAMMFHPPMLYTGYVGFTIPFAFAVGALLKRHTGPEWIRATRRFALVAWTFLGFGILLGSLWSYSELGWGGYWAWDPVENASLMPWLAATALLHSVAVLAARNALKAWTMMLAVIAFTMSMVGTFLVRSGILTSVHSFAVDPTRGGFILALLGIYVTAAFVLFAVRAGTLREGAPFELVSREAAIVVNNLLLTVILGIVFIGTLYPLMAEAVSGEKISVGAPYFNAVAGPLAIVLGILLAVGPLLSWRQERRPILRKLALPALFAATALVIAFLALPQATILSRFGLALAAGLIPAAVLPLIGRNPLRTPLAIWGMAIAHLGAGVAVAGMAADSAFTVEKLTASRLGETVAVGPWLVRFEAVAPVAGPNWTAVEAELRASRGGGVHVLRPQSRFFTSPPTETNEAAIKTLLNGQLYTVLGQSDAEGRYQLRLWWKPLVTLIWFGGVLVGLGGLLAFAGHARRSWRRRRA